MNLDNLYNQVSNLDKQNKDFNNELSQYKCQSILDDNGKLMLEVDTEPYYLTNTATQQICERLNVPFLWFAKQDSELQALIFNEMLRRVQTKEVKYRTRGDHIRALLSTKYSPFDHTDVIDVLRDYVSEDYEINPDLSDYGDYLHLRFTFFQNERKEKDSIYRIGMLIANSETGLCSVTVQAFVYRLVCTNGMVTNTEEGFKRIHVGIDRDKIRWNMIDSLRGVVEASKLQLERFLQTKEIMLEKPYAYVQRVADKYKLSKSLVENIQTTIAPFEPDQAPLFDVINGFTKIAQDYRDPERTRLESIGGQLVLDGLKYAR